MVATQAQDAAANRGLRRRLRQTTPFYWVTIAIVCLAVLTPLGYVLVEALAPATDSSAWDGVLNWFSTVSTPEIRSLIVNSVIFAFGSLVLAFALGLLLAILLTRVKLPGGNTLAGFLPTISLLLPPIVGALGWAFLAGPQAGLINVVARLVAGRGPDWHLVNIYSLPGLIWVGGLYLVPYIYLYTAPALQRLDGSLEEAAQICGARKFTTLRHISLPLIRPAVTSALLITGMLALAEFSVPLIIGTPINFDVLTSTIWRAINTSFPADYQTATILGSLLLVPAIIGIYAQRRVLGSNDRYSVVGGKGRRADRIDLGKWKYVAVTFIWAYVAIAVVLPIVAVVYVSSISYWTTSFGSVHFTIDNFVWLRDNVVAMDALTNSGTLALIAGTIGTCIGVIVCVYVVRTKFPFRFGLEYISMLPAGIPNMIYGVGFLLAFLASGNALGLYNSTTGLLLAYCVIFIPFSVRGMIGGFYQVGGELEEAARISGASRFTAVRTVVTPLVSSFIATSWILLFVLLFRELPVSALIAPAGRGTVVSAYLIDVWQDALYPKVAVFALAILVVNVCFVVLAYWLERRTTRWARG